MGDLPEGHELHDHGDHGEGVAALDIAPIPPGALELDTPTGPAMLDAPTVDSDADGLADTVVVPASGDDLLGLATDLDGDTHVDVLTTIDAVGVAHTVTFPDVPAPGAWDEGVPPPPPVIDPATGRWTRDGPG